MAQGGAISGVGSLGNDDSPTFIKYTNSAVGISTRLAQTSSAPGSNRAMYSLKAQVHVGAGAKTRHAEAIRGDLEQTGLDFDPLCHKSGTELSPL